MDESKMIAAVHHFKGMVDSAAEAWFVKFGITLSTYEEKNEYGQCLNLIAEFITPYYMTEQIQIRPDVMDAIDKPQWPEIVAKAFELLMEKVQQKRLTQFLAKKAIDQMRKEL